MEIIKIFIGLFVIFSAGLVQGTTSFGFSLLALPLLGFVLPLKIIVPMLIIFSFIMNSMILYKVKEYVDIKRILILTIVGILATPFGADLLIFVDENILKIVIGIIVTLAAVIFHFGVKFPVKNEKLAFIPVGILSGLLNGSLSISGPPVILFLSNQGVEKQQFRATLTAYFWILNIMTIIIYSFKGLLNSDVIKISTFLLPALIIGVALGIKLGNKVNEKTFKFLTTILIIATGILSIISA